MSRVLGRVKPEQCTIFICDVQEKFEKVIHKFSSVVKGSQRLVRMAAHLNIPVVVTEQYPKGLGHTVASLSNCFEGANVTSMEKTEFTMLTEPVRNLLATSEFSARKHIVIAGIEAHICVQQTVLDLVELGYSVHLCIDAISSQQPTNRSAGLHRADRAGAFLTSSESLMFELIQSKDHPQFKVLVNGVLKETRDDDPLDFF